MTVAISVRKKAQFFQLAREFFKGGKGKHGAEMLLTAALDFLERSLTVELLRNEILCFLEPDEATGGGVFDDIDSAGGQFLATDNQVAAQSGQHRARGQEQMGELWPTHPFRLLARHGWSFGLLLPGA